MKDWWYWKRRHIEAEIRWKMRREVRQFGCFVRYTLPNAEAVFLKSEQRDRLADELVKTGRRPIIDSLTCIYKPAMDQSPDIYDRLGSYGWRISAW